MFTIFLFLSGFGLSIVNFMIVTLDLCQMLFLFNIYLFEFQTFKFDFPSLGA